MNLPTQTPSLPSAPAFVLLSRAGPGPAGTTDNTLEALIWLQMKLRRGSGLPSVETA